MDLETASLVVLGLYGRPLAETVTIENLLIGGCSLITNMVRLRGPYA